MVPTVRITAEQARQLLDRFADGFSRLRRSPVLHSPSERGLDYEDVTFPSRAGVPLEGWFIPAVIGQEIPPDSVSSSLPLTWPRAGSAR